MWLRLAIRNCQTKELLPWRTSELPNMATQPPKNTAALLLKMAILAQNGVCPQAKDLWAGPQGKKSQAEPEQP